MRLICWCSFLLGLGAFLPLPYIQDSFSNIHCGSVGEFQSPERLGETAISGDSVLDFTLDLDDDMVGLAWRRTQVWHTGAPLQQPHLKWIDCGRLVVLGNE